MSISQHCGDGDHTQCNGWSSHHYEHPEEDTSLKFTCACGCHYVPAYLGQVPLPQAAPAIMTTEEYAMAVEAGEET